MTCILCYLQPVNAGQGNNSPFCTSLDTGVHHGEKVGCSHSLPLPHRFKVDILFDYLYYYRVVLVDLLFFPFLPFLFIFIVRHCWSYRTLGFACFVLLRFLSSIFFPQSSSRRYFCFICSRSATPVPLISLIIASFDRASQTWLPPRSQAFRSSRPPFLKLPSQTRTKDLPVYIESAVLDRRATVCRQMENRS